MLTVGVDLASQAARTAACRILWTGCRAEVLDLLPSQVDDAAIVALAAGADKVGIDVPFGWPIAFAEAVAAHSRDSTWPAGYVHAEVRSYCYRRTDEWLRATTGMIPLSVSSDRIALPAMRAAALLPRLDRHSRLDGSGRIVEAYPAAALKRWGFPSRQYKGADHRAARLALVERLLRSIGPWLAVDGTKRDCLIDRDDAFDALVAALVARAAAIGLVAPIPDRDRVAACREGWMALPLVGSLDLLPDPKEGDRELAI